MCTTRISLREKDKCEEITLDFKAKLEPRGVIEVIPPERRSRIRIEICRCSLHPVDLVPIPSRRGSLFRLQIFVDNELVDEKEFNDSYSTEIVVEPESTIRIVIEAIPKRGAGLFIKVCKV